MPNTIVLRQQRAALIKEARAMIDTAEAVNRDFTLDTKAADGTVIPGEQTIYDRKHTEAASLLARVEREERQMKADAELAVTNQQALGDGHHVEVAGQVAKRAKGQGFINCVRAIGFSRDRRAAAEWAEQTLHDPEVARALSVSIATGGGFAVPTMLSEEFIEFLRPASVVRAAEPRVLPLPNGNLSLPKITGGASASYIGENTNIPATQQQLGNVKLTAKKLAALIPISNDLIRYANPNTDAVIRADLIRAVAQTEDYNFLRGAGTQYAPKGMRNWAVPGNFINPVSSTTTLDITHITSDLGNAIGLLLAANVQVTLNTGHWFFSPRSMIYLKTLRNPTTGQYAFPEMSLDPASANLLGYGFSYTSQIPINLSGATAGATGTSGTSASEWYFVNMPDAVIGEGANLVLDVSTEAAYVDAGGNTVSAFAQDQTVIRVIEENDFVMRYDQSIAVAQAVNY
jgi:HK97 family phage major capsid protein